MDQKYKMLRQRYKLRLIYNALNLPLTQGMCPTDSIQSMANSVFGLTPFLEEIGLIYTSM